MRKEDFTVGSYVHVVKRGTRGLPIVRDDIDRFRFLLMLTHFNDTFSPLNWYRDLKDANLHNSLLRPEHWPVQKRLVNIIAFCLVENHFHLILQELAEGNTARFMQRLGIGMAKKYNERYKEHGSLFQGVYGAKTIDDDRYFRYVSVYVQLKNALDMYPGGQNSARENFYLAYDWACNYPYSSIGDYAGNFDRPTVDTEFLSSLFTPAEYKEFAKDVILGRYLPDEDEDVHKSGFFD
ncbi:MAG: transposase [Candidatus Paceibacterota bacterium]|jgi:REP element-mobilizing transposase RayT